MHIAQIAPLTEAVPPKLYGGTERVVSWLTEELIALGHQITLFASGDSVSVPANSTFCIFISTTIHFRCFRASRRRS